jgi:hypothetical protein
MHAVSMVVLGRAAGYRMSASFLSVSWQDPGSKCASWQEYRYHTCARQILARVFWHVFWQDPARISWGFCMFFQFSANHKLTTMTIDMFLNSSQSYELNSRIKTKFKKNKNNVFSKFF